VAFPSSSAVSMPVAETIPFSQLAQKLEEYRKDKVVPVLLDQSESNSVDTFLQYQHTTIIEGKKCVVDKVCPHLLLSFHFFCFRYIGFTTVAN